MKLLSAKNTRNGRHSILEVELRPVRTKRRGYLWWSKTTEVEANIALCFLMNGNGYQNVRLCSDGSLVPESMQDKILKLYDEHRTEVTKNQELEAWKAGSELEYDAHKLCLRRKPTTDADQYDAEVADAMVEVEEFLASCSGTGERREE